MKLFHHASHAFVAAIGAFFAIFIIAIASKYLGHGLKINIAIFAPIGASAALVFGAPFSAYSQPANVIIGNIIAALSGIIAFKIFGDSAIGFSFAVGAAILFMMLLGMMHPPGGGLALLMVITHHLDIIYVLIAVILSSVLLVLCGIIYHRLSKHHYPHIHKP
ncbi:MAG: HPP family protein [Caulobacterales bacterium]|nr:HPP family protein [Caulobacterales bacterium]MCA0373705.1 HPP family protein [Pseudomonadota bacterium]